MGLPDPSDVAAYDEFEQRRIGGPMPLTRPIELCDYDPSWPERYADTTDEPAYVDDLEPAGYVLRIREPDWFEHRFFRTADGTVHLHVKRELAARDWKYMQQYADAKTGVVEEIMARAIAG